MNRLPILFALFAAFASFTIQAQTDCDLTLTGKVVSVGGETLPGAGIVIDDNLKGTVTDVDGKFSIQRLCKGKYQLTIKFLGYADKVVNVALDRSKQITITLAEKDEVLEEVVVADQFHPDEETRNHTVLGGKALEESKGKSFGEVLKDVPGVSTIQTGPSIFKPVIHGVHSQRILILNNGIRQEGQQWGAEHAPEIDPFIASNIVVIKDAGAIKYGTNALGGVILVNPPDLPRSAILGGELNVIGQSNGRSGIASGMLEGGVKKWDGLGWRVQGTAKKSGDFHAPDYNLSNTGFREMNFSLASGYHRKKGSVELFYSHFNTDIGILRGSAVESVEDLENALEREPPQNTRDFTYDINNPRQHASHDLLKLNGEWLDGKNAYRLQYGFQMNKRKEFDVRKGTLNDIPSINLELATHTLDVEWARHGKVEQSIGINGMLQDNNNIYGTQRIPFIPNFASVSGGVYVVEKVHINKWIVDAGVRYDYRYYDVSGFDATNAPYTSEFDFHNISATAGASVVTGDHGRFVTSLGSTWRPPHVAELYSFGRHQSAAAVEYGLLIDENSRVEDIHTSNVKNESGIKWVSTYEYSRKNLTVEVSGYYNYIFNYIYLKPIGITETFTGPTPALHYEQTDASFLGLDISAAYPLMANLKAQAKVSLLRATDHTTGDYLYYIPSNRYELDLRYELPQRGAWKNFYADTRLKYVAKQNRAPQYLSPAQLQALVDEGQPIPSFDFAPAPPGYFLWNFSTGISHPINKARMDFRIGVDNVLNTRYREYTNRMKYYADDLGRNFLVAVKYVF